MNRSTNHTQTKQNIDPKEIAKFEALASRWWDPNGEFKPLHDINPLRANYIDQQAAIAGKKVIDVGCGGGLLTEAMSYRGATVTGIDMGQAPLEVARLHQLESGLSIDYQQVTAESMAEQHPATFDVVTCLEMLEHVPNPASTIKACADLCKVNGDIFFSTINRNPKAWLFAIAGAEYVLNMLPKGTHSYQTFIKPSELSLWCRQAGLELIDITGISYNPLTRTYRLSDDVDVNYMIHTRKPNNKPTP